MSLCPNCIEKITEKLTPNDIYVLHQLQDKAVAQTGETKKEIFESLEDSMTDFQLYQALMRMEFLGFIGTQKRGRSMIYYIKESGIIALNILSER